jgi:hypothetical protein
MHAVWLNLEDLPFTEDVSSSMGQVDTNGFGWLIM